MKVPIWEGVYESFKEVPTIGRIWGGGMDRELLEKNQEFA
jgi:hypothetical protein